MKPQYQTRYELLHESYQKWLTGFTRHAVSWGVCHPNIHYFHNLTPGWVSFNGDFRFRFSFQSSRLFPVIKSSQQSQTSLRRNSVPPN